MGQSVLVGASYSLEWKVVSALVKAILFLVAHTLSLSLSTSTTMWQVGCQGVFFGFFTWCLPLLLTQCGPSVVTR